MARLLGIAVTTETRAEPGLDRAPRGPIVLPTKSSSQPELAPLAGTRHEGDEVRRATAWLVAAGLAAAAASAASGRGATVPAAISLDEALAEARTANATLPVPALDEQIADQRQREAAAQRRWLLWLDGDLQVAPTPGYDPVVTNLGEERLQVAAEKTLYDGGALAAQAARAAAERAVTTVLYRRAVSDVELGVREEYAAVLAGEREVAAREEGLRRLGNYLGWLAGRQRAGQAVTADLVRTRVRLAVDRSGRPRRPSAPGSGAGEPGDADGTGARRRLRPGAATAAVAARRRGRRSRTGTRGRSGERRGRGGRGRVGESRRPLAGPRIGARFDFGLWGSDTTRLVPGDYAAAHPGADFAGRLGRDLGYSFTLGLSWPLFDFGANRARAAQAESRSSRRVGRWRPSGSRPIGNSRWPRSPSEPGLRAVPAARRRAARERATPTSRPRAAIAAARPAIWTWSMPFLPRSTRRSRRPRSSWPIHVARALELRWGGAP